MSFIADKQTLDDLNLVGKYKSNSVYSLFNKVRTTGGEKLLDAMFRQPLQQEDEINKRISIFKYFQQKAFVFPFDIEDFGIMESYLSLVSGDNKITAAIDLVRKKWLHTIGIDKEYESIVKGLYATINFLNQFRDFLKRLNEDSDYNPFYKDAKKLNDIFLFPEMHWLSQYKGNKKLPLLKVIKFDTLLRRTLKNEMSEILEAVYYIDVYIAVSDVSRAKKLSYAKAFSSTDYFIRMKDCRHPAIERAVANSVSLNHDSNVIFLTGANMAGKSTFMKSFSIALYLAHMGFPVAAEEMEFSIRDGMYTSINVPDNLQLGYSHFYAEVRRVKTVAEDVGAGKNLLVIFDELFKGTNVKDAFDATLAVTTAFSEYKNCFFIISTHIIEVAEELKMKGSNIQFLYLPTIMEQSRPRYTYRLEQGVTADRHGMMIINNENLIELIRSASPAAGSASKRIEAGLKL